MCGIVGVFSFSGEAAAEPRLLEEMRDSMSHRGPDDTGTYFSQDKRIALGFRRLSILDLSPAGHQPMTDASGRYTVVFNGEIYNFQDLREELIKRGRQFKSRSDTEVLLALYAEKGEAMLSDLRGMFAFAIWDEREKKLFMARDRVGKKPLYWTEHEGRLIFASEIKAILKFPGIKRAVNEEALYHYLSFRISPAPLTLFQGIHKLPCGHSMTVLANGQSRVNEYWNAASAVKRLPGKRLEDFSEPLVALLRESIRYRMVSDVPFGVFLSGGIDSTANVALMAELMDKPVETFSVGYTEKEASELDWARRAAQHYKTNHHEVILKDQDMVDMIPELIHHQDEPIADPVCVPVYAVSKLARQNGVTVCQVGEGADELFCGYPDWLRTVALYKMRENPLARLGLAVSALAAPFAASWVHRATRWNQWERLVSGEEIFWSGIETFSERSKKKLLGDRLRRRFKTFSSWEVIRPQWERYRKESVWQHPLQWMALADLKLRLPELLLMRVDKMSMANSIETRVPFLDHKFVEFALGIDPELRAQGRQTKAVLKRALHGILPDDILYRPKKGFAVPLEGWFDKALGGIASASMERLAKNTDYFNKAEIETWMKRRSYYSWYLLNFSLWHERWIEGKT